MSAAAASAAATVVQEEFVPLNMDALPFTKDEIKIAEVEVKSVSEPSWSENNKDMLRTAGGTQGRGGGGGGKQHIRKFIFPRSTPLFTLQEWTAIFYGDSRVFRGFVSKKHEQVHTKRSKVTIDQYLRLLDVAQRKQLLHPAPMIAQVEETTAETRTVRLVL